MTLNSKALGRQPTRAALTPASRVLALQQAVGNRAVAQLVQRRVVRLDGTIERTSGSRILEEPERTAAEANDSYASYLAARDARREEFPRRPGEAPEETEARKTKRSSTDPWERSLEIVKKGDARSRVWSATEPRFLEGLQPGEKLYLVGHGGLTRGSDLPLEPQQALEFGGYTPSALAELLIRNGLPLAYKGRIYLEGCNSAAGGEGSYAAKFQGELARRGCFPEVKANLGPSSVSVYGSVDVSWVSKRGSAEIDRIVNDALQLPKRIDLALQAPAETERPKDFPDLLAEISRLEEAVGRLQDVPLLKAILAKAKQELTERKDRAGEYLWLSNLQSELRELQRPNRRKEHARLVKPIRPPLARPPSREPPREGCVIC